MSRVALRVAICIGVCAARPAYASSCGDLSRLSLPATTITSAELVAAGTFDTPRIDSLPEFCRVRATLKPSSDSDIKIEVWLPATRWNGKFQGVGNGGWAGVIDYTALADAVKAGYVGASTDTGHVGDTASFAIGHPEKLIDMGYRAVHEMTVRGKSIAEAFYGAAPAASLFNGCSLGGRQAVTEANRYPADYDAVIAGAPSIYNMSVHAARVALNAAVQRTPDSRIPDEKYAMVHDAVLSACDALDGVEDGVIDDPLQCTFDPQVLACRNGDSPSCLTPTQVETMRLLYAPIQTSSGDLLSAPLLQPGTELGWNTLAGRQPVTTALEAFKYVVFNDPTWTVNRFDPASDISRALDADQGVLSLIDPNLAPYFSRGGKLMLYHGWQDPQVPAQNTIRFFNDVLKTMGPSVVGESIQLYMVPGMDHCGGGPGASEFNSVRAMEEWLRTGSAPARIIAAHATPEWTVDRTRPLCPFGQVAQWNGTGSIDEAANFACVADRSRTIQRAAQR